MSTTTLFPAAVAFLDQVRELLGDLTDEDREEVIQDLEAHLEDLGVTSIEQSLGTAEAFVDEFRASAGLSADSTKPRGRVSTLVDGVVDRWMASWEHPVIAQLNKLTEPLRPAWPWIRAWLALMLVAFGTAWDGVVFRRFPIPSVNGSAVTGLAALALVTWISVTAQRRGHRTRRLTGGILNLAAAIAILIGVFAPYALMTSWAANSYQHQDTVTAYGGLVGPYGDISNIHAYDRDGNPVEVLLYDQDGNPLSSVPGRVLHRRRTDGRLVGRRQIRHRRLRPADHQPLSARTIGRDLDQRDGELRRVASSARRPARSRGTKGQYGSVDDRHPTRRLTPGRVFAHKRCAIHALCARKPVSGSPDDGDESARDTDPV